MIARLNIRKILSLLASQFVLLHASTGSGADRTTEPG